MKTLSLLACLVMIGGFTSAAQAESNASTSSLVISDKVFFVPKPVDNETNVMPVTSAAKVDVVAIEEEEAEAAPQSLTPMPETKALVVEPQTIAVKHDEPVALSWRARGGEKLQDVLSRWGNRTGQSYSWATRDTAALHRNFSFFGTYQDAVHKLLSRESKPAAYISNYTNNAGNLDTGLKKND